MKREGEIEASDYSEDLKNILEQLVYYRMPFGMFGPREYPPKGVLLIDLPIEYLSWFEQRSYPKGQLGELIMQVYELKAVGMDHLFDPIRKLHGGRTVLDSKKVKRNQIRKDFESYSCEE